MKKNFITLIFLLLVFFNLYTYDATYNIGGIFLTQGKLSNSLNNAPYLGITLGIPQYDNFYLFSGLSYSEGIGIEKQVLYFFYDAGNGQKSTDHQNWTRPAAHGNLSSELKVLNIPVGLKYQKIIKTDYPQLLFNSGAGAAYIHYSKRQFVGNDCLFDYDLESKSNNYLKPFLLLGGKVIFTENFSTSLNYFFYINKFDSYKYNNIRLTINIKYF